MSQNYYYLTAVLPHLKFGESPSITTNEFLSECEKWLTPADLCKLKAMDVKKWNSFDAYLRSELARARKARKESGRIKMPLEIKEIMGEETPLLSEEKAAEIRWNFLEEIGLGHYFDLDIVILYSLKLQILERLAGFNEKKGREVFEVLSEVAYE
ncbi:MAG: hypothetical protein AUJ75_02400 [Candidatus Omnitrophica bacterium CG1_02_49_10]|nr:MAG: hypothetical protein AUJ75_02400 [Candidatus Omnitrophica bacterium CG1_02_49_10]